MAALILLAGCLSGHAELGGDFRPPNAQLDSVIDERRKFRLCLPLVSPGAADLLQRLWGGYPGNPLRLVCGRIMPRSRLHMLES
jgi:hypothetical protein